LTELTIAAGFWGFGFVGTIWALEFIGFSAVIFYRFFISFVVGFAIVLIRNVNRKILTHEMKIAIWPAVFLSSCLILQTWGLKTVSASKSSFITVMYVVIVPIIARFWSKENLSRLHWVSVLIALMGTALLVDLQWSA
jgi:drug/metabolite transporter (DMT)-like permease